MTEQEQQEEKVVPRATFINIGERTNVTGSAKFKKLILEGDYTAAVEVARQQVESGAQVLQVFCWRDCCTCRASPASSLNRAAATMSRTACAPGSWSRAPSIS